MAPMFGFDHPVIKVPAKTDVRRCDMATTYVVTFETKWDKCPWEDKDPKPNYSSSPFTSDKSAEEVGAMVQKELDKIKPIGGMTQKVVRVTPMEVLSSCSPDILIGSYRALESTIHASLQGGA